jgi:hypothetical protein
MTTSQRISDWVLRGPVAEAPVTMASYIEPLETFLSEDDAQQRFVFPGLLPEGVTMLLHGHARARKSLTAAELAMSAATGTAPFGLARFTPEAKIPVLYVQEEDPRSLTRPRLRALITERCGAAVPETFHVSVRRGIDLDDPLWVDRLIGDITHLGIKLVVLDAARRLSALTDEGPAKVRLLIAVLRSMVDRAGVTLIVVHHDTKPPQNGQDQRSRNQRASGGDWFAACECPVHVEKVGDRETLVYPLDYKFSTDPGPFTFKCEMDSGPYITRLVGTDIAPDSAERAGTAGKIWDWLDAYGPASKSAMKKAGLGRWETIESALDALCKTGKVDSGPGRNAGTHLYFTVKSNRPQTGDGSRDGA